MNRIDTRGSLPASSLAKETASAAPRLKPTMSTTVSPVEAIERLSNAAMAADPERLCW